MIFDRLQPSVGHVITARSNENRERLHKQFKVHRNHVVNLLRISKENYYKHYFEENKNSSFKTWKGVREIINLKPGKSKSIKALKKDGMYITSPDKISNSFNNYFSSIANKVREKIPHTNHQFHEYLKNPNNRSLFL